MKMEMSTRWSPADKPVLFNLPYVDKREHIDFFAKYNPNYAVDSKTALYIPNGSLTTTLPANWLSGQNFNDNMTINELNFVITGNALSSKILQFNGVRCRDNIVPWCNLNPVVAACTGT